MPTSVPGISSRRGFTPPHACGFTLIELLVVLLVMGLAAGLIGAIAQPDDRARLRVEAERLAALLDLAATEAGLTGRPVAWTGEGTRYRFWRWREEAGWAEAGDALRARELPAGMTMSELRLEFDPYVALSYEFHMSLGDAHCAIAASALGEVRIDASP